VLSSTKKYLVLPFIIILVAGVVVLYKNFNPATNPFPKCPFRQVTGLECPGCGSQRALHHLLNLEIKDAFYLNPLLVISIPYILIGFLFEYLPIGNRWYGVRKFLFGPTAIKVILVVVVAFWIGRNL